MGRRTSIFLVAAALFAVSFPGCDPGYDYRPIDLKGVALHSDRLPPLSLRLRSTR
jgi:hypothetical protein